MKNIKPSWRVSQSVVENGRRWPCAFLLALRLRSDRMHRNTSPSFNEIKRECSCPTKVVLHIIILVLRRPPFQPKVNIGSWRQGSNKMSSESLPILVPSSSKLEVLLTPCENDINNSHYVLGIINNAGARTIQAIRVVDPESWKMNNTVCILVIIIVVIRRHPNIIRENEPWRK
jgi:hypothetical protein